MAVRIGINGFGRIGRLIARAIYEQDLKDVELVAINDPGQSTVNLLKYDSVHGRFGFEVTQGADHEIFIEGKKIHRFRDRDPANTHWGDEGVDIVMECTGKFRDEETASMHLKTGAKKVLISAPAKGNIPMVVYGVNHSILKASDKIVSNASCTTNCLAPLAHALHQTIGIERGFMTTVHAYTGDQRIVDASHKDPFRGRAGAINMVPTTTGAAKAVGVVLPELAGKLDGVSVRVPTPNVSMVDLKFVPSKATTVEDVNAGVTKYAEGELKGILGVYDEPLVSGDFNHYPESSVFSTEWTRVIDENLVRVMAWYDNEWAFSCRMLDTAKKMHEVGYE